ncbi:MAG TPA: hypothetical protein VFI31_17040 [Pirellulales bacterium]|nr:hypothetical protein [Pirellulales bacterium]
MAVGRTVANRGGATYYAVRMYGSPLVFCERTGYWAAAWRRVEARLSAPEDRRTPPPHLIETRSASECREVLATRRGSFVVAELSSASAEQTLDLLWHLATEVGETASAVVATREWLPYEWLARELGAQAFVVSPFGLEALREVVGRRLRRAALPTVDLQQRIWENLPWS